MIKWEYRGSGQASASSIWTYRGSTKTDTWYGNSNQWKFDRVKTDITKEHAIRLKQAELTDEGTYSCKMEYFGDGNYFDGNRHMQITVISMKRVTTNLMIIRTPYLSL